VKAQWLPKAVMDRIRENPRIYQALRAVRWGAGNILGARPVPGIHGRVHYNDFMFEGTETYLQGTKSAISIIEEALDSCHRDLDSISSCLEIGSGYGRLIRQMVQLIPSSKIYACDVIEEAARFCSSEFGVNYLPSPSMIDGAYGDRFDLIYLISVFTHIDADTMSKLWSNIVRMLRSGGVVVLTTHGQISADQIESYGTHWAKAELAIRRALRRDGYYYRKYKWYNENIGMSWVTEGYMRGLLTAAAMEFRWFRSGGLDNQDVYCYQKNSDGACSNSDSRIRTG
jgi:SAM-dependent methyltransferase